MMKHDIGEFVFTQRNTNYLVALLNIVLTLVLRINDSTAVATTMILLSITLYLLKIRKLILKGKPWKQTFLQSNK